MSLMCENRNLAQFHTQRRACLHCNNTPRAINTRRKKWRHFTASRYTGDSELTIMRV